MTANRTNKRGTALLDAARPGGLACYRVVGGTFVASDLLTVSVTVQFNNRDAPRLRTAEVFVFQAPDGWRVDSGL